MNQTPIKGLGKVNADDIVSIAERFGTPIYVYDESAILDRCSEVLSMPNAFGLMPRYAMKANSNSSLLRLIADSGFNIDASSLNEVRRMRLAGIPYNKAMLTTQEIPIGKDRRDLETMILNGMNYNVCSFAQLQHITQFAYENEIPLSMRVHPGVGSGESQTRNTGDKYSCFGIHLSDIEEVLRYAKHIGIKFNQIHVHIGSGGDPEKWKENVDREIGFVEKYFPDVRTVNFGGGFKVARMPGEKSADIKELGEYAKKRIEEFYERTDRKLSIEVEPGTYIMANSGFIITTAIDRKKTGEDGFEFMVLNGGMEINSRPLYYGSKHPFYVISKGGNLLSSEFELSGFDKEKDSRILVGRCCESGDSQSLDETGHIVPRVMALPKLMDYVVIGGCGAYCSSMTPFNYNSHTQAPEVLLRKDKSLHLIRKPQSLRQVVQNEINISL